MPLDLITAKLIVDVLQSILPFGHIAGAWADYLKYKEKTHQISLKMSELEAKVPLVKEYIRSQTKIELERLRNERYGLDKRIAILEGQLTQINLDRMQIHSVINALKDKLGKVQGDDLRYVTQAINHLLSCLTSQTVSLYDLLGKEVSLQLSSIEHTLRQHPKISGGMPLIDGN
jgi:hypothetical protein